MEDLVQETFLKAWRGIDQFQGENARSWLLSIARSVAIDHARKRKPLVHFDINTMANQRAPDKTPEEWAVFREEERTILRLLGTMKPHYRDVVICRAFLDMTAVDTAALLNWTRNRVDVTMHRAIKSLRALLAANSGGEENDVAKGR